MPGVILPGRINPDGKVYLPGRTVFDSPPESLAPVALLSEPGDFTTAQQASSATLTLDKPANVAVDDLLIALVSFQVGAASGTITEGTSAFTIFGPDVQFTPYRPATTFALAVDAGNIGSLPSSWTFTSPGTPGRATGLLFRVTGADLSSGVTSAAAGESAVSNWASGVDPDIPSYTRTADNALVIVCAAVQNTSAQADPFALTIAGFTSVPNGYLQQPKPAGGASWSAHAIAVKEELTAGTEAAVTPNLTPDPNGAFAWSIAIAPAVVGGGTTYNETPTDSVGLTDAAVLDRELVFTDSTGLTDNAALTVSKEITDNAGLTDAALLTRSLVYTDSAGLTDTSLVELVKLVTQTDSAGLTDAALLDRLLVFTDSAGLTDAALLTRSLVYTDSVGLTDTSTIELVKLVAATDSAGLTDAALIQQAKTVTDSAGLTDAALFEQSKVLTDSAGLTDTSAVSSGRLLDFTDSSGLTDTTAFSQTKVFTDSSGLTDAASLTQSKVFTDSAGLTDTSAVGLVKAVTQTDSVGLTDSQVFARSLGLEDLVGLTDTTVFANQKVFTDSAGLTDDTTVLVQIPLVYGTAAAGNTFGPSGRSGNGMASSSKAGLALAGSSRAGRG